MAGLGVNNFKHSYPHIFIPIGNRKSVDYVVHYTRRVKSKSVGYICIHSLPQEAKEMQGKQPDYFL